jgi:hypothetical protein
MQIRTVLLALAASATLSTAAFAAVGNPHDTNHPSSREQFSDRCAALESQYNGIIDSKQNAPKLTVAEGLHARGIDQCNSNEGDLGMLNLQRALHDLGVKPAA